MMDSIRIYKEQIIIAEELKKVAEQRVLHEKHYRYSNLVDIRNFLADLRKNLDWHEKRKHEEFKRSIL